MRSSISSAEIAFRRLAIGRKITLAAPTPISVAMKAAEIEGPERGGRGEVLQHVHEAQDRADDAHRRGEAAGLLERRGGGLVARGHAVDLGLEDRVHHLGVGAVDDQLQGVAGERVLDLAELARRARAGPRGGPCRPAPTSWSSWPRMSGGSAEKTSL